jgi:hypothetical protein
MRKLLLMAIVVATGCGPPPRLPDYARERASEPARPAADGEVLGIDYNRDVSPGDTAASGARLSVETGEEPIAVELAPEWYLDDKGLHHARSERATDER